MTAARTVLVALAALALMLAVVLLGDGVGVGDDGRGGAAWPSLFEDDYDRQAYQQRGRWIASGGRPYLDEFSEYPQLTTWAMGIPYLFFDHGVTRGEPFTSKARLRTLYERAGAPREAERAFREFTRRPFDEAAAGNARSPVGKRVAALAAGAGVEEAAARAALTEAWRAQRMLVDELKRNRATYGDLHHVFMALWMAALAVLAVALLRTLGHAPAWALMILLPSSLYFGFNRFDAVVTTMVVATLLLHVRGHLTAAAFVLGLAVMTKWFPVALAPLLFSHAYRRARADGASAGDAFRRTWLVPGAIVGAVVVTCLGITWSWGDGGLEAVRFVFDWHAEVRQPNKSSLLMALTAEQQWAWFEPSTRPTLEKVFKVLQLAPGFLLALLPLRSTRALIAACLAATLCALFFSEFFSPQWVLWTTALSLLLAPTWRRFLVLSVALELLLRVQMLFHGHAYAMRLLDENSNPTWAPFWTVNSARTVAMAAFLVVTLWTVVRAVREEETTPRAGAQSSSPSRAR